MWIVFLSIVPFICLQVLLYVFCNLLYLQVYIIDFGLAKRYRDPNTNKHIPYRYVLFLLDFFYTFYLFMHAMN